MLLVLTAYLSSSCEKEQIAPSNQEVAFVKYYGHVGAQTATDVVQTADGGYILLGSTNSYSSTDKRDIFVVKTDSLGNELWSSAFGRQEGNVDANFDYLRFDEEGIRIIELPDQSAYIVAANRTYYNYPSSTSQGTGVEGQTKIALYQLDYATGAPTTTDGVELQSNTNTQFTEKVSDMKLDTAGGYSYVVTGYSTNVNRSKPYNTDQTGGAYDNTDVFTVLLNSDFTINSGWTSSNWFYGFPWDDYGASIQILPQGYLICGISHDGATAPSTQTGNFLPRIHAVLVDKSGGTPLSRKTISVDGDYFSGAYSVYDADNNVVTIAAHVTKNEASTNGNDGQAVLLQLQILGLQITEVTAGATVSPFLRYYDLKDRNGNGGVHSVASIALLPGNNGFIMSSTHEATLFESDICITKFDTNLDIDTGTGWPYFFGYADGNSLVLTSDQAGTILPIMSGSTAQSSLTGYVFTGKFGLGTNNMMGLVKLNLNGTLSP